MDHYMGIDIGTSGCKAIVFDENGQQLSLAYREYNVISENDGWAELDTNEVIKKCFEVIKESVSRIKFSNVAGLGISSQGEAFTLIDKTGKALCNAFVSSDTRATKYISELTKKCSQERLYQITGHTPHPMFSLFKLRWAKENLPEIWSATDRILCFEDLLQYRLGVKKTMISWSLAGRTMLFDVINHHWSKDILQIAGIKPAQLSVPVPSGTISGYVNTKIAKDLGLPEKTFIVAGGHDQSCSALGAGAIKPGIAAYASGTVECIAPAFQNPVFSETLQKSNLCTYDHVIPGMYTTVAFSLTGGNILKWFRNEFGDIETTLARKTNGDAYELLLSQMPDNPTNLLVLPYFTPSGTPYFDLSVKGAIIGLDLSTSRGEIIKGLLEGVTFEMKLNLEILEKAGYKINELRVIGGGAKSKAWNQLRADILGKTISVPDVTEAGCKGVAMLARAAHSGQEVTSIAEDWVKPIATIKPSTGRQYNQKFEQYKKMYPTLKDVFFK